MCMYCKNINITKEINLLRDSKGLCINCMKLKFNEFYNFVYNSSTAKTINCCLLFYDKSDIKIDELKEKKITLSRFNTVNMCTSNLITSSFKLDYLQSLNNAIKGEYTILINIKNYVLFNNEYKINNFLDFVHRYFNISNNIETNLIFDKSTCTLVLKVKNTSKENEKSSNVVLEKLIKILKICNSEKRIDKVLDNCTNEIVRSCLNNVSIWDSLNEVYLNKKEVIE